MEAGTATVASPGTIRRALGRIGNAQSLGVVLALAVLVTVIGTFHPDFLAKRSVTNVISAAASSGIIALGMVFLLSMREIVGSVGSLFAVALNAIAVLIEGGMDPWIAVAIGLAVGVVLGFINGVLSTSLGIATIIITLGTLSMYRGLALVITGGQAVGVPPEAAESSFFTIFGGKLFDIPASVYVFVALSLILALVYGRTRYGYVVRAIGSNPEAARLSGISVGRYKLITLSLVGLLCAVSAALTLGELQAGDPTVGTGYELLAIAAAIIGGTALSGGSGSVVGAALGALAISVISSGLIFFGVTASWGVFATGAMIIVAVSIDRLVRARQARYGPS